MIIKPYSTQSMLGWVIEASRRGMWQADPTALKHIKRQVYGTC
ncbi:MAG: hypothetical protein ACOX08_00445 [Methanobacterium sp.]